MSLKVHYIIITLVVYFSNVIEYLNDFASVTHNIL